MLKPQGFLFDLDGTLLDTAPDLGNALNHVLSHYSLPNCEYNQYRPVASHGSMGLINLGFADRLDNYDVPRLRQQLLDFYNDNICVDTVLFDGVNELIIAIEKANLPWGIVTNKPGWLTDSLLPNFDTFRNCQVVVSGDTIEQRKPHPAPLLLAADSLKIKARNIWYVGDAERDIEAANAASMVSVLANYGYISDKDDTKSWQADMEIQKADELISIL